MTAHPGWEDIVAVSQVRPTRRQTWAVRCQELTQEEHDLLDQAGRSVRMAEDDEEQVAGKQPLQPLYQMMQRIVMQPLLLGRLTIELHLYLRVGNVERMHEILAVKPGAREQVSQTWVL